MLQENKASCSEKPKFEHAVSTRKSRTRNTATAAVHKTIPTRIKLPVPATAAATAPAALRRTVPTSNSCPCSHLQQQTHYHQHCALDCSDAGRSRCSNLQQQPYCPSNTAQNSAHQAGTLNTILQPRALKLRCANGNIWLYAVRTVSLPTVSNFAHCTYVYTTFFRCTRTVHTVHMMHIVLMHGACTDRQLKNLGARMATN